MTTQAKLWTVNAIKDAARAEGSHWFDPSSMRFFGTRVLPEVYQGPGGVYFVTSEQPPHGPRQHSVRSFDPATAKIGTVGELASMTRRQAVLAAKRAALGNAGLSGLLVPPEAGGLPYEARGVKETVEPFRPVTVPEQFLADLRTHGNGQADAVHVRRLMRFAARHLKYREDACNISGAAERDAEEVETLEVRILADAQAVGAVGVRFGGDPRGCTVKLVFPDGFTNDFGREGYCVPAGQDD